ncbi:MAG: hypothetical protein JW941_07725 [Candidatus Coatesbacteria bacterium]|nr:hypothetical protein [Candidatus Coatesbacteria bacterium]
MGQFSRRVLRFALVVVILGLSGLVFAQQGPEIYITITSPSLMREEPAADGTFNIQWTDGSFGYITLFYDSDTEEGGEVQINPFAFPALEFSNFAWNTSSMPNLTEWYIVGKIRMSLDESEEWIDVSYSIGTVYINRVLEPVIRVGPDTNVTADRAITLSFQLRGVGYYYLFYDVDREPGGEGVIMGPSSMFTYPDFTPATFDWETKDLPHGQSYYIVGRTKSSTSSSEWSYSETSLGKITIDHTQSYYINVQEPSGIEYLPVGDSFQVYWEDHDPNVLAYVNFYTDTDIDDDPSDDVRRTPLPIAISGTQNNTTITFNDLSDQGGNIYYVIGRIVESNQGNGGEILAEGYAKGNIVLYRAEGQDTTPPAAVQDLRAEPWGDGANVTLRWTAPGDDGNYGTASSYNIRYSTTLFENDADFASGTQVPYIDTVTGNIPLESGNLQMAVARGLSPSTVYYFALKATDDAGNISPMSNIAWTDPSLPVELSSFEAVPGVGQIILKWTTASERDAMGWHVARADQANGEFSIITNKLILASGTSAEPHSYSYTDTAVTAGTTYYYKLVLYNLDGSREESLVVSGSPLLSPTDPISDQYPLILAGGFMGSVIETSTGGQLTIMAMVDPHTGSGQIEKVELLYMGIPAAELYDDGTHGDDVAGDNIFHATVDVGPGLAAGDYILEIVATDTDGNQSPVFPYVTVR